MTVNVSAKVHFNDLGELIDRLDRLHRSGGWVQSVAPNGDSFTISYSNGQGVPFHGEFELPPDESQFLNAAITAGALSAHAVNGGSVRQVLLDFAAAQSNSASAYAQLKIDRGVGRGS